VIAPAHIHAARQTLGPALSTTLHDAMMGYAVSIAKAMNGRSERIARLVEDEARAVAMKTPADRIEDRGARWDLDRQAESIRKDHQLLVGMYRPLLVMGAPPVDERDPDLALPPVPRGGSAPIGAKHGPNRNDPPRTIVPNPPPTPRVAPAAGPDTADQAAPEIPAFTATRPVKKSDLAQAEKRILAGEDPAAVYASLGVVPVGTATATGSEDGRRRLALGERIAAGMPK
jgi:hypothetical protein